MDSLVTIKMWERVYNNVINVSVVEAIKWKMKIHSSAAAMAGYV